MKLLAIDTSTDYLALAIMDEETLIARIHKKAPRSHSSLLMPMVDKVLKESKTGLNKLDGFCVSIGPGSFTGLRIGVTTVKGLAFVTKKPIVAVPTLDAIAENGRKKCGIICPVLDARKNKVYASIYKSDGAQIKKISKPLLCLEADLLKRLEKYDTVFFLGDYAERIVSLLPRAKIATESWQPRPEVVGRLGMDYFKKRKFVDVRDLEPFYIYSRECDIIGR